MAHQTRTTSCGRWTLILLAGVAVIAVIGYWITDGFSSHAPKRAAQDGCSRLAVAIKSYTSSPANTKRDFPHALNDLHHPPWGGPSFLDYGPEELLDPWGKPYQMEQSMAPDGNLSVLVFTTAPDGTRISQYGIGPSAEEKK